MITRKSIEGRLAQIEAWRKTLKARCGKQEHQECARGRVQLGALALHRLGEDRDGELCSRLCDWLRPQLSGFLTRDAPGVFQVFSVDYDDSARLVSALLGRETVVRQITGRALGSERAATSYYEQHAARSLMATEERRNLPTDAELLFLVGTTGNQAGKLQDGIMPTKKVP